MTVKAILCVLVMALSLLMAGVAAAAPAPVTCVPQDGQINYRVYNDDQPVGRADMVILRNGRETQIHTAIDIDVKMLGISLYRYRHKSVETWRDGRFQSLRGVSEEPRRRYDVRIDRDGDLLHVNRNGEEFDVRATLLTELVWCQGAARSGQIVSTLTGGARDIPFEAVAGAMPAAAGRPLPRHFRFFRKGRMGELRYGADGIVERASYATRFGTTAIFKRIGPGAR